MVEDKRAPTPPEAIEFCPEQINGNFIHKHIVSMDQFDARSVMTVIKEAEKMAEIIKEHRQSNILGGIRILPVLLEPSTRTRLSSESSGKCLGAVMLTPITNPNELSLKKGESFKHTIRAFEANADIIIMRHKDKNAIYEAIKASKSAIFINGGNGSEHHPTQGLLDLKTLFDKYHRLDHLTVIIGGDSLNGRAIHSFIKGLSFFEGNTVYLYAPRQFQLNEKIALDLEKRGLKIVRIENEDELPKTVDALYWIRGQLERVKDPEERKKLADILASKYKLTRDFMNRRYRDTDLIIMHCLPIVNEVSPEIDEDPRTVYLDNQMENGVLIRMALPALVSGRINPNVLEYNI